MSPTSTPPLAKKPLDQGLMESQAESSSQVATKQDIEQLRRILARKIFAASIVIVIATTAIVTIATMVLVDALKVLQILVTPS